MLKVKLTNETKLYEVAVYNKKEQWIEIIDPNYSVPQVMQFSDVAQFYFENDENEI